jgi:large subunit ribosomal protein L21
MKFAVIKTGGKQYIVRENDEIYVDRISADENADIEFDVLATGDAKAGTINIGTPLLKEKAKGKVLKQVKGDKLRVARFKAKVRYRKVRGFRPFLSQVKIISI